ncbi:MAG: hypothetical protein WD045_00110 [Pirellulaceae bacterium]
MNDHHSQSDDLLLQATRYVLEEMDAAERDHFEEILLEDQPAREAVASAVELLVVTHAAHKPMADRPTLRSPAPRHPADRSTAKHPRRFVWWLSAVAASLLVAAVAWMQSRPVPPQGDIAQVTPEDEDKRGNGLAQVWARSLDENHERENVVRGLWWDPEMPVDLAEIVTENRPRFEVDPLEDLGEDELASVPPSWMLTALAAQQENLLPATDLTEQQEESRQ